MEFRDSKSDLKILLVRAFFLNFFLPKIKYPIGDNCCKMSNKALKGYTQDKFYIHYIHLYLN